MVKSILFVEKLLGLVEMTSGLVNATFSLPEGQAVKMIFFAPWIYPFYTMNRKHCGDKELGWILGLILQKIMSPSSKSSESKIENAWAFI